MPSNVLLVDDQPSRLLSYEAILAPLGERLVFARSGVEALQRLMEAEYAAIILDVNMPGMDGFETARLIHQHPRHENTPIIFVTAVHVTDLDELRGYELGAVDYVYVPVVPEVLRSKVQVLAELYRQRRELQALNERLARANADLEASNSSLQAEKSRALERLNADLARANEELAAANAALALEIGERREAEAALQEADRRKDEFLATLAHELRNPLAPLRSALEVLARDPEPAVARRMHEMMSRQLRHMVRLVDDLLDVSRISRDVLELRREWVALDTVIETAIETARPLYDRAGHRLHVELPPQPVHVWGDPSRLAQIVANLLTNAAKYTAAGGQVWVAVDAEEQAIAIRVRDTGIGIAPERIGHVFDLFVQGDHADGGRDGLGIGLTLVKRLVELHDGRVEASSDGVGRGSEFRVLLPRAPAGEAAIAPLRAPTPRPTVRPRVLVVDDNEDAAVTLVALLGALGVDAVAAHGGEEALRRAVLERPEAVVLDLGMPGMSGFDVARELRQRLDPVPLLIALSGWAQAEDRRRTAEAGFDHHLVKPADGEELVALLGRGGVGAVPQASSGAA